MPKCQKCQKYHHCRQWQRCGTAKIPKWFLEVSEDRPQKWTSLNTRQKISKSLSLEGAIIVNQSCRRTTMWWEHINMYIYIYVYILYHFITDYPSFVSPSPILIRYTHIDIDELKKSSNCFLVQWSHPSFRDQSFCIQLWSERKKPYRNGYCHWHLFKFCRKILCISSRQYLVQKWPARMWC